MIPYHTFNVLVLRNYVLHNMTTSNELGVINSMLQAGATEIIKDMNLRYLSSSCMFQLHVIFY